MTDHTEAGQGEHGYYWLRPDDEDDQPFVPGQHYLGLDAVTWFVNNKSNWLRDRMASGTLRVELAGEPYEAALGTYELKGGERSAPIFDRTMLGNRVFRGGDLTLRVFVQVIAQDTLLGGLLRDMSGASLKVIEGALLSATQAGPPSALREAGSRLIQGVERTLNNGAKQKRVFDPAGLEISQRPTELRGRENFLLLHRGARLDPSNLKLQKNERGGVEVAYGNVALEDGAWVLLRLRREESFGWPREWDGDARAVRNEVRKLVNRWELGGTTDEAVLAQLRPSGSQPPTAGDRVLALVDRIRSDWALTEAEAVAIGGDLLAVLKLAQQAATAKDPKVFSRGEARLRSDLQKGTAPSDPEIARVYQDQSESFHETRKVSLVEDAGALKGAALWKAVHGAGGGTLRDEGHRAPPLPSDRIKHGRVIPASRVDVGGRANPMDRMDRIVNPTQTHKLGTLGTNPDKSPSRGTGDTLRGNPGGGPRGGDSTKPGRSTGGGGGGSGGRGGGRLGGGGGRLK